VLYLTPTLGFFQSAKRSVKNTWFLKQTKIPDKEKKSVVEICRVCCKQIFCGNRCTEFEIGSCHLGDLETLPFWM
jgi:hypothetical protein